MKTKETILLGMAGSMLIALYAGVSSTNDGDNSAIAEEAEDATVEVVAVDKAAIKEAYAETEEEAVAVEEAVEQAEEAPEEKAAAAKADVAETAQAPAEQVEAAPVKKGGIPDYVVAAQRKALAANTAGKGFGPQSPRDIDNAEGTNPHVFAPAPDYTAMNLCNIHFHEGAEHKGGEFTKHVSNGDGKGHGSGYLYSGELTEAQLTPLKQEVCQSNYGSLQSGDTIELHYVHSMAPVKPGQGLGSCLSDTMMNPQLRVETQVYVLTNDGKGLDFADLTHFEEVDGLYQATNIPGNTGEPVVYAGSTTGPGYNEKGSPLLVTWSVRPEVAFVDIASVGEWCKGNAFKEDHAHGVRNLVINPELLSPIK